MVPHRSTLLDLRRPLVTGLAFLAAMGSAVGLTRFGGGVAFLWVANAVLLASLTTTPRRHWPGLLGACWVAGVVAAGLWGLGWRTAPLLALVNVAEPLLATLLLRRWDVHRSSLDSARNLVLFVLAVGAIAPMGVGLPGALVIAAVSATGFAENYLHWVIAHALGAMTFTPVFVQFASGEIRRWVEQAGRRRIGEATLLLLLVAGTAAGVFGQGRLPLLFLPVLPLMLATFRVGRVGAAAGVVVIAVIGTALTFLGHGPVNLIHAGLGERLQFLHFYLATTVLTVLPVAADLTRRALLFERLRDSEARFRLLTEHSTDIVLSLAVDGRIRYASPSIERLGGYDPAALIGTASADLVDPADRAQVRAAHLRALAHPDQTVAVEFRALVGGDAPRWFETHTRAVTGTDGVPEGVVSAVRETSHRRRHEAELSRAAHTDPLTGLCNRRAFDRELPERVGTAATGGCVALFDLDRFKAINDGHGHPAGDAVLREVAARAQAQVRGGDFLARIGGEEFALILSGATVEQAYHACERIREAIAGRPIAFAGRAIAVTASVGLCAFRAGDAADAVLRAADAALYRSKDGGRNRSSLAA